MHAQRFVLLLLASLPLLSGCKGCNSPVMLKPAAAVKNPEEALERMIAAYKEAKAYEDNGVVRVEYKVDGKLESEEAGFAVKLARPNRLSLEVYHLEVKCDGEKLHALITDPLTGDLDGQVVERVAPAELALADLLADEELQRALSRGPCRQPVQLELLLAEKPLELFLADKSKKQLLPEESLENRPCYVVEVTTDEGAFKLWIDRQDFVLRRMAFPISAEFPQEIAGQLGRKPADVTSVSLLADFIGAKLGGEPKSKDFEFAMPRGAKLVRSFLRPPQPLPSALFGQRPREFHFSTLDGERVIQANLDGKLAVLLWFVSDDVSRAALERLEKVREKFAADARVTIYAISADPKGVSNEQLARTLQGWSLATPVLRDAEEFGNTSFEIPVAPTLVVLDSSGQVQIFEAGANPRLDSELPAVLTRLLKGDNLAAELVRQSRQEMAAYQRHLAAGTAVAGAETSPGSTIIELPPSKIDPWQEAESLKLTQLWKNETLETPGNLLVVETSGEPPRIFVNEGFQKIAELDAGGKVVSRHELPAQAGATYVRSAVDAEGKRYFIASANLGKQLFLFDEAWKLLLTYPSADQTTDALRDVQLFDLDGDGKLEICVGFWGSVGLQGVDLEGKKIWGSRLFPTVLSLTQTPPNPVGFRKLLVTGERGTILRVNQFGNADPEIRVANRAMHHLYGSQFSGTRLTTYMGLSYLSERNVQAVALDEKLQEQWSYPLPEGVYRNQIQYVTSGMLFDAPGWFADVPDGQWVFAGANGSVHIVSDEGDFNDFFNSGESLSGIACTRFDGAGVIMLSSDKGVTAWKVERR